MHQTARSHFFENMPKTVNACFQKIYFIIYSWMNSMIPIEAVLHASSFRCKGFLLCVEVVGHAGGGEENHRKDQGGHHQGRPWQEDARPLCHLGSFSCHCSASSVIVLCVSWQGWDCYQQTLDRVLASSMSKDMLSQIEFVFFVKINQSIFVKMICMRCRGKCLVFFQQLYSLTQSILS